MSWPLRRHRSWDDVSIETLPYFWARGDLDLVLCDYRKMSVDKKEEAEEEGRKTEKKNGTVETKSWLLRFFESQVFNMSYAIGYLFTSKDPGVQQYIGKSTDNIMETKVH